MIDLADTTDGLPDGVKALRTRLKLTQAQLAERLNVCRQTVINWERGKANPSQMALAQIARLGHDEHEGEVSNGR